MYKNNVNKNITPTYASSKIIGSYNLSTPNKYYYGLYIISYKTKYI